MKPTHRYLLRHRLNGENYYLELASEDGLEVVFTKHRDQARKFTRIQINEFREQNRHIVGRVVLL